ncbi:uncharacterized protein BT62DRAFT_1078240 [Guyanagaster necrorhizus]|uniref:HNH nuclease domain-containing protein n=1 Tax=Guyanagaster necrorhizus TaxID=856835 RepID=A0A9P8AQ88_9AGAR|nr:uncharacterized protein BT62DRAFT_1078240 [Guyanagaster necrorhizus MCA 3950]KAG7443750.1 hypothetical protein BT62DRAFT_1078240 [Guyanagaster necrorhizus MCA 3950]
MPILGTERSLPVIRKDNSFFRQLYGIKPQKRFLFTGPNDSGPRVKPNRTLIHPTTQEAKKSALARDNYRCILSGTMDKKSYFDVPTSSLSLPTSNQDIFILFRYSVKLTLVSRKTTLRMHGLSSSERFGFPNILQDLRGEKIHRLENILTLEYNLHLHFDDLTLWLEPTSAQRGRSLFKVLPRAVDFTSIQKSLFTTGVERGHPPCCHLSGAAEYLNLVEDDNPFKAKIRGYDPVGSDFGDALVAWLYEVSEILSA